MRPIAKVGLIAAGYVGAVLVAGAVMAIYVAATDGPDRQTYGGMYAFGDSLLFLAVFGVAAAAPTAGGLYFLRPYRRFWRVLSIAAVAIAATGVAAAIGLAAAPGSEYTARQMWSIVATLRILAAPLIGSFCFIAGLFAPGRSFRTMLFVATMIEAAAFAFTVARWTQPFGSS